MNKYEKLVQAKFLNDEDVIISRLKRIYRQSFKDITGKIAELDSSIAQIQTVYKSVGADEIGDLAAAFLGKKADNMTPAEAKQTLASMLQAKIYQKDYQKALQKQVDGILDKMHVDQYSTISDYLKQCYEDGFVGTMYNLHGQGIPLILPIDQEAMVMAVQLDSKISKGLYSHLGEDVTRLKKRITTHVTRGISSGMTYAQVAQQISASMMGAYTNPGGSLAYAMRIARTEGHRIQVQSTMNACQNAKDMGADVVKQWDSTLDGRTRPSHQKVDGEIRELDEPFSNGLMFPGDPAGGAGEVVNCRCALLQRARWALDADELDTLQERAKFFGLDKTDNFDEFKQKYLKITASTPATAPKKTYLTQKKLEQLVNDGNSQLDDLKQKFTDAVGTDYDDFFKNHKTVDEAFEGVDEAHKIHSAKKKMDAIEAKYGGYDELTKFGTKADHHLYGKYDDESFHAAVALSDKGLKLSSFGTADDVEALYQKMKAAKAFSKQIDTVQNQVDEWTEKLNKKIVTAETKKLKKQQILLQDQLDAFDADEKFSGIWYKQDDITIKEWKIKSDAGSIQGKIDWYEEHIKNAALYGHTQADVDKFTDLLNKTKDFDQKGKKYFELQKQLNQTAADLKKLQNGGKISTKVLDDAFTQDRKDAALWAKNTKNADDHLRSVSGDVWKQASKDERYAIYDYTCGSGKFNRPLSGFEKPYSAYGSGWEPQFKKGVGNVWIDYEGAGDEIRHMTNLISRSTYDEDIWLQRGCGNNAMESFLNLSPDTFGRMSESELQQFVGQSNRMYSFTSTGVAKGKGFSGDCILNIYAPKGTQMMYAEPFSRFGNGSGLNWDGVQTQSSFGYESEMIIQRGAYYKITKIEKSGGTIFIDMEVHPEQGYDLIQQDPSEWKGSTKKGR